MCLFTIQYNQQGSKCIGANWSDVPVHEIMDNIVPIREFFTTYYSNFMYLAYCSVY